MGKEGFKKNANLGQKTQKQRNFETVEPGVRFEPLPESLEVFNVEIVRPETINPEGISVKVSRRE